MRNRTDFRGGVIVNAFGELQKSVGTPLIDRKRKFNFIAIIPWVSTTLLKIAGIERDAVLWVS